MRPTRKVLISTCVVGAVLAGGIAVTATATMAKLRKATTEMTARQSSLDSAPATPPTPGRAETADPTTDGHGSVDDDTRGAEGGTGEDPLVDLDVGVPQELTGDSGRTSEPWPTDRIQSVDPLPIPQVTLSVLPPER